MNAVTHIQLFVVVVVVLLYLLLCVSMYGVDLEARGGQWVSFSLCLIALNWGLSLNLKPTSLARFAGYP